MTEVPGLSYVYCLVDDEGRPRYVGVTINLEQRMQLHRTTGSKHNPELNEWVDSLPGKPQYVFLEEVPYKGRQAVEAFYITAFRWAGATLFNRYAAPPASWFIAWRGQEMTVREWEQRLGLPQRKIRKRLWRGRTLRQTLTASVDPALLDSIGPDDGDPVMHRI